MKSTQVWLALATGFGLSTLASNPVVWAETLAQVGENQTWYNCLTREVWKPEKKLWCQKVDQLKNRTYSLPDRGEIPLQNGIYKNEVQRLTVNFVDRPGSIAFGDLNKDGVEDAATLLVVNSEGSGSFVYLSAVINQLGTQETIASLFLGDRIKINSIAIAQDQITVDMIAHGSDEPLCCPSKKVRRVYKVQPQLVQVGE